MTKKMYIVYDKVACESGPIFEAKNDGVAIRGYQQMIKGSDTPQEFQLLCIGKYDHDINKADMYDIPEEVIPRVDGDIDNE